MNTKKIWYFICALFLFFNLKLLIDDCYNINYVLVENDNKLNDPITYFLICLQFDQIRKNDKLNEKIDQLNVSVIEFLNYSLTSIENNLNDTGLFKLELSYVFHYFVCYHINKTELESSEFLNKFLIKYNTRLYSYSNGRYPYHFNYIYHKRSELGEYYLKVHKMKVYGENYLKFKSKCVDQESQIKNSRFHCLNRCFKKYEIDFGFHTIRSSRKFNLNLISNKLTNDDQDNLEFSNQTEWNMIKQFGENNFKYCLANCKENDCFHETFQVHRVRDDYYRKYLANKKIDKIDLTSTTYRAYYSNFDFNLQIFGLLNLFTGTSITGTIPSLIKLACKKLKLQNHSHFELVYKKFYEILISFSLLFVILESNQMLNEYNYRLLFPNKTTVVEYDSKKFDIIFCFTIEELLEYNNFTNHSIDLTNYTINEIEQNTRIKKNDLFRIYFGREVDLDLLVDILFKNDTLSDNQTSLIRCFRFRFNNLILKSAKPLKKLNIHLLKKPKRIFVLDQDNEFDSKINDIKGEYYIAKFKSIKSKFSKKSNCSNYDNFQYNKLIDKNLNNKPEAEFRCTAKYSCIDRCIISKYYFKYRKVSIVGVINLNALNLSLDNYFDNKRDYRIENDCQNQFKNDDCIERSFYETLQAAYSDEDWIRINLSYKKVTRKEFELSFIKIILDILNLEIIFFSTNVIHLLIFLVFIIKRKFKWFKIHKSILILICLIGFLIHNFYIFKGIIKDELIKNEYFLRKENPLYMPHIIICFYSRTYETKIDPNYRLTINYLDNLIKSNRYENIFSKIDLFNKTHRIIYDDIKNYRQFNSTIEINHFYYLSNYICYEFIFKIAFDVEDHYLIPTNNLLTIHLNSKLDYLINSNLTYLNLIFRDYHTRRFSQSFPLRFEGDDSRKLDYEINFESVEIERDDKYELLKNPTYLFRKQSNLNDKIKYLNEMNRNFKQLTNLITRDLFPDRAYDNKNLEFDQFLFNQFFLQIQNKSDHEKYNSLNFKKNLYNVYNKIGSLKNQTANFAFSLSMSKRVVSILNQDNYVKLLLNLLNTLSLWLDICILDLYNYLNVLTKYQIKFYNLLINFKFKLINHIYLI